MIDASSDFRLIYQDADGTRSASDPVPLDQALVAFRQCVAAEAIRPDDGRRVLVVSDADWLRQNPGSGATRDRDDLARNG